MNRNQYKKITSAIAACQAARRFTAKILPMTYDKSVPDRVWQLAGTACDSARLTYELMIMVRDGLFADAQQVQFDAELRKEAKKEDVS